MAQLDIPNRSTVFRLRRTQLSLSGIVPSSVAHWKTVCSGPLPGVAVVRAIEMRAGLRCSEGRERIRSRRAVPRVQAVVVLNVVKVCSGEISWVVRTLGCW